MPVGIDMWVKRNIRTDESDLNHDEREWSSMFNTESITWGESNGYWSENLNSNWKFSPENNVSGAPSMSIRILWWKTSNEMQWQGKQIFIYFRISDPSSATRLRREMKANQIDDQDHLHAGRRMFSERFELFCQTLSNQIELKRKNSKNASHRVIDTHSHWEAGGTSRISKANHLSRKIIWKNRETFTGLFVFYSFESVQVPANKIDYLNRI